MPRKTIGARRCYFCNDCLAGGTNLKRHCQRVHTDIDKLLGLSLAGYRFRRLDEEDNANVLVAIKGEGNPRNVMYCLECQTMLTWHELPEPRDASRIFAQHTCSDYKRPPSKLKGLKLTPKKEETTMTAKAGRAGDGAWVSEEQLVALSKKYPGFDVERTEENNIDVTKTLEGAARSAATIYAMERKARQLKSGATSAAASKTSDDSNVWDSVAHQLCEESDIGSHMIQLIDAEQAAYSAEQEEYDEDSDHDADDELPNPNVSYRALHTALVRSKKMASIQSTLEQRFRAQRASLEAEIQRLTVELNTVRASLPQLPTCEDLRDIPQLEVEEVAVAVAEEEEEEAAESDAESTNSAG